MKMFSCGVDKFLGLQKICSYDQFRWWGKMDA